jgi:hypothetical protein
MMNTGTRILSAALVAWLVLAAWSFAQVESNQSLNLLVSNDLLASPATCHTGDIVFRNRLGGMCFTATADMIAMQRANFHSFTLLSNGRGGTEALNANELNFEMRTGPKLNLILHEVLFGNDLEIGYMFIDGYSLSKSTMESSGPLFFNGPLGTTETPPSGPLLLRRPGEIRFDYISRIYSAEANLRHDILPRVWLLAGFRYVDLHEQLGGTAMVSGQGETPFITSNIDNHLYGGQLGAGVQILKLGEKIMLVGVGKAGMFSNQSDLTLFGGNEGDAVGGVKGQLAFLGEVDLVGSYCITENIAVRLGYQAMWLSGVGTASDQLDLANGPTAPAWHPNTQSSLFYHGAFLGLEISF